MSMTCPMCKRPLVLARMVRVEISAPTMWLLQNVCETCAREVAELVLRSMDDQVRRDLSNAPQLLAQRRRA